jgi:hypothetical protein
MSETPPPPLDDTRPLDATQPWPAPPPPGPAVAGGSPAGPHGQAPLAVQPLLYSTPIRTGRPGVLTAVGVISIVVAGISALASLSTGMQALAFAVLIPKFASMPRTATVTSSVPTPVAVATTTATASDGSDQTAGSDPTSSPASAGTASAASGPSTTPATAPAGLSPSQIQSIVQRVQQISGNGLNPSQVATLQTALQQNSPPRVSPAYSFSPVLTVDKSPDGSVDIQFNGGGALSLNPGGRVVSQSAVGSPFMPSLPRVGMGLGAAMGIDALASIALAVLLLVAGIQVFRNSPGAARLHRIFAVIKIPVGLAGAAAVAMMNGQIVVSMSSGRSGAGSGSGGATYSIVIGYFLFYALLSCAYPVALLIVLRTRTVRAYYQSVMG